MIPISITKISIIFCVGFIGNFIGSTTGGGALLAVPACIFLGFIPQVAVATTRFSALGATASGWIAFHNNNKINYKIGIIGAIIACGGSIIGAHIMVHIPAVVFQRVIAGLIISVLIITIFKKHGLKKTEVHNSLIKEIIGYSTLFFVGIYCGIFGAGQGILFNYALILMFSQTFLEAAGTRKVITFIVSFATIIIYQTHNIINWPYAITFLISGAIGSYCGALYGIKKGDEWVRRVFMFVIVLMAIKLLL